MNSTTKTWLVTLTAAGIGAALIWGASSGAVRFVPPQDGALMSEGAPVASASRAATPPAAPPATPEDDPDLAAIEALARNLRCEAQILEQTEPGPDCTALTAPYSVLNDGMNEL